MSYDAEITDYLGDDEYTFALKIAQLARLQERREVGPMVIFNRLRAGAWMVEDLQEVIRLALIGAGMAGPAAKTVVDREVVETRLMVCSLLAFKIMAAALSGAKDDPVGEPTAPTDLTTLDNS